MNFTLREMKLSRHRNMHLFQVVLEVRWLVLQRKKMQSIYIVKEIRDAGVEM